MNDQTKKPCYWLIFYKDQLILEHKGDGLIVPFLSSPSLSFIEIFPLDFGDEQSVMVGYLKSPIEEKFYQAISLRESWNYLSREWYDRAGKAYQLVYWRSSYRFCPTCGSVLRRDQVFPLSCPRCQKDYYPVISPAIIVLIRKGEQVLLVHARNFRGKFHGLVAGFLEVGETLEQCIRREVMEETGLTIQNITYFGSQPWPYPSGIMIGFMADYESGTIKLQDEELSTGSFFSRDHLPELPQKLSIARRMIDHWIQSFP